VGPVCEPERQAWRTERAVEVDERMDWTMVGLDERGVAVRA
jgi:hypothetical protein